MLQTLQEPYVDLCQLLDAGYCIALFQSLCNCKDSKVCRISKLFVKILELDMVVAHESVHALTNHTKAFLHHLLEAAANAHYLTYRLHAGTNLTADTCKLSKVPTWNLTDHVVEIWSNISR